ncbi:MAG: C-type lectin domain-containing protein [Deltaproteobacteria bacterium]
MGVVAALGGGGRRLVGTWRTALLTSAVLSAGCFPREDLADYSSSSGGQGGALQNPPPEATAGAAGRSEGQGGTEMGPDSMLPLAGGSLSGDAGASTGVVEDAGALDAGLPPPDPDAGDDAGPIADACASTQGTLEPGTTVCLFFASQARVTWQAADLACQTRNSELVSVKTEARNDLLTTLIGTTNIWIGARDPGADPAANAFVWRDGNLVSLSFDPWATGEPDAIAGQLCVSKTGELAVPPEPAAPWRDRPCADVTDLRAYVCEQTF